MKGEKIRWSGSKVVVLGLGRSGCAAAEWLLAQKAEVTMFDESSSEALKALGLSWSARGAQVLTGKETLAKVDFHRAIISPGVDPHRPVVLQLKKAGVPILGELELGYQACLCPLVAVTGTNGKSTTTELIAEIYRTAGKQAVACGNLGLPLCEVAPLSRQLDVAVVEVSSFQLETIETFRPKIAVYLNLSEDHLDRYPDLKSYAAAKARIFENQTKEDVAILQEGLAVSSGKARRITFSATSKSTDFFYEKGWLCSAKTKLLRQDETHLQGPHNAENLLAAWAVAESAGISEEAVRQAFRNYRALPHRCEVVAQRAGVTWINDSKATNLDAMERAVAGMPGPVILIAGGKDKGFDFTKSRTALAGKVRAALLLGEMAEKIETAWKGAVPCRKVVDMADAVNRAAEMARAGETVLLSPGCSSYDMFKNFEDRGEKYRQGVFALPEEKTTT